MRRLLYIFAIIAMLAASGGCARRGADPRLTEIAAMVADSPAVAIDRLDAIGRDSLTDSDRAFYDLLTVKARDKAYITHSSDSLILSVIDYYERHRASGLYPEALYYGGRVYADMGDAPSALRHFQTALDELPDSPDCLRLKSAILSQTGRLLNSLRLYDKAASYLEDAITVNATLRDSINLMWNTQLLGAILFHQDKYYEAEHRFKAARIIAESIKSQNDVDQQDIYLAAIKMDKHEFDSARNIIRPVMEHPNFDNRNHALVYAASIYLNLNILDTAYMYAGELTRDSSSNNQIAGIQISLSPQFTNILPRDTIFQYVSKLRKLTEQTLNQNKAHEALLQSTLYNYNVHESNRIKSEKEKSQLWLFLLTALLLACVLSFAVYYLNNRNEKYHEDLVKANNDIRLLRKSLESKDAESKLPTTIGHSFEDQSTTEVSESATSSLGSEELKESLKNELLKLLETNPSFSPVPDNILNSKAYLKLQDYINKGKQISDSNELWTELDDTVIKCSDKFKYNLRLLMGTRLKDSDYHMALLIKCGVTPTQMMVLLGKAKGTISYRREAMCIKIFGKKLGAKFMDGIIRKL